MQVIFALHGKFPWTSGIIMALKVHHVPAPPGTWGMSAPRGSLSSSSSLPQSLLGPVGPSTLFNTQWLGGFDEEFLPRPHSQLPSLFPPDPNGGHISRNRGSQMYSFYKLELINTPTRLPLVAQQ